MVRALVITILVLAVVLIGYTVFTVWRESQTELLVKIGITLAGLATILLLAAAATTKFKRSKVL